ncbi:MAG: class I SAM-dependent methyltransferase, partial [Candidatus Sericytochromatia bacterium]
MKLPAFQHPGLLRDVIGWDIGNWQQALGLWDSLLPRRLDGWRGLELGAQRGGLSLYFGLRGAQMICSDYASPRQLAEPLHRHYGVKAEYAAVDACRPLPFASSSLDLVCFKSVLGGIRKAARHDPKPGLIGEITRVLRPGGWLLLAENLQG